jgi:hypothetical protein
MDSDGSIATTKVVLILAIPIPQMHTTLTTGNFKPMTWNHLPYSL